MAQIQILKTPPGTAPDWVREEWVGLTLPTYDITNTNVEVTGEVVNRLGYCVSKSEALEVLGQSSPEAVEWWRKQTHLDNSAPFVFAREVCHLL